MVVVGFVGYVEIPRGLRALTSVLAVVRACCVEIVRTHRRQDPEEGFRWSLSLISRMLTRVINEIPRSS